MSEHKVNLSWSLTSDSFDYKSYNRRHEWQFDSGQQLAASAAPDYFGDADCVDPEEALVASVASCHMLTFLALSAKFRFVVKSYSDQAVGYLEKNENGKLYISRIELKPQIAFDPDAEPTAERLENLHERAHKECFIANSIKAEIKILS